MPCEPLVSRCNMQEDANRDVACLDKFRDLFFLAALILLQKSVFSLNDSHAFNRAEARV